MKRESLSLQQLFTVLFLALLLLFGISAVAAWTGPTGTPPNDNAAAPINVGTVDQVKDGGLGVDALAVFGDELIQTDGHLNFGDTSGDSGYGIRDDAGVMQYKDANGTWISFDSLGSGGSGTSGTNGSSGDQTIYNIPGTYTWTKPATGTTAAVQCWGGGGAGLGDGGGGGGYVSASIPLSQLSSTVTVTVGAGGSGNSGTPDSFATETANPGGNSSFGSYAVADGGNGAEYAYTANGWAPEVGAGGSYSGSGVTGEAGGSGGDQNYYDDTADSGGSTTCSGAGGGAGSFTYNYSDAYGTEEATAPPGPGGASGCGGNGGSGVDGSTGAPGTTAGGGGGGGSDIDSNTGNSSASAPGARGECIVTVS